MEPKKLYSISWTQTWPEYDIIRELLKLQAELIEQCLDNGDFKEAEQVITRIKSL
jgi:hypothetical protein